MKDTISPEPGKAPAIARAAAALRLLGRSERPMALGAIARELGIGPSSCLYVLRALVAERLVAFDPDTKRYSLDAGILVLARQWLRQNPFPDQVRPLLDALARRFGVTMLAVRIAGLDQIVVLATSATDAAEFRLGIAVGSRFPALISATGRCIAAFGGHPAAALRKRFAALRWDRPPTLEQWLSEVEETRARGFGIDRGNYIAGVTVVAAPVWRPPGELSHAIVAIGVTASLDAAADTLAAAMVEAAADLSG